MRKNLFFRVISLVICFCFLTNSLGLSQLAYAQNTLSLPAVGTMVGLSTPAHPAMVKGIKIDPQDPLALNFLMDPGTNSSPVSADQKQKDYELLIKYFLAALTTSEQDMWVNLSPYEGNRVISDQFGMTEMGRDLLAQDYILKQLTASLINPDEPLGKKFWERVYDRLQKEYGITDVSVETFNKVWIIPDKATVYEQNNTAVITDSRLKVMMEEDYLALNKTMNAQKIGLGTASTEEAKKLSAVSSKILKEVILPEIEHEVNEGSNFAQLRQVYQSMILAAWFKKRLKENILTRVYANKNKVNGVELDDQEQLGQIFDQYVEAYRKGVYDFIREDVDPATQEIIPRKYFSGGWDGAMLGKEVGEGGVLDVRQAALPTGSVSGPLDEVGVQLRKSGLGKWGGGKKGVEGQAQLVRDVIAEQMVVAERSSQVETPNSVADAVMARLSGLYEIPAGMPINESDHFATELTAQLADLFPTNGGPFLSVVYTHVAAEINRIAEQYIGQSTGGVENLIDLSAYGRGEVVDISLRGDQASGLEISGQKLLEYTDPDLARRGGQQISELEWDKAVKQVFAQALNISVLEPNRDLHIALKGGLDWGSLWINNAAEDDPALREEMTREVIAFYQNPPIEINHVLMMVNREATFSEAMKFRYKQVIQSLITSAVLLSTPGKKLDKNDLTYAAATVLAFGLLAAVVTGGFDKKKINDLVYGSDGNSRGPTVTTSQSDRASEWGAANALLTNISNVANSSIVYQLAGKYGVDVNDEYLQKVQEGRAQLERLRAELNEANAKYDRSKKRLEELNAQLADPSLGAEARQKVEEAKLAAEKEFAEAETAVIAAERRTQHEQARQSAGLAQQVVQIITVRLNQARLNKESEEAIALIEKELREAKEALAKYNLAQLDLDAVIAQLEEKRINIFMKAILQKLNDGLDASQEIAEARKMLNIPRELTEQEREDLFSRVISSVFSDKRSADVQAVSISKFNLDKLTIVTPESKYDGFLKAAEEASKLNAARQRYVDAATPIEKFDYKFAARHMWMQNPQRQAAVDAAKAAYDKVAPIKQASSFQTEDAVFTAERFGYQTGWETIVGYAYGWADNDQRVLTVTKANNVVFDAQNNVPPIDMRINLPGLKFITYESLGEKLSDIVAKMPMAGKDERDSYGTVNENPLYRMKRLNQDFFGSDLSTDDRDVPKGTKIIVPVRIEAMDQLPKAPEVPQAKEDRGQAAADGQYGGIDFNDEYLNLDVQGEGINIPVPEGFEWLKNTPIDGFVPRILEINSGKVETLPFFSGIASQNQLAATQQ